MSVMVDTLLLERKVSMPDHELRAIVFVPLQNFTDDGLFDISGDIFSDDDYSAAFIRVKSEFKGTLRWKFGPLTPLTEDGIPGQPFNSAIGSDLPLSISNLIGFNFGENTFEGTRENFWQSRRHINLIGVEISSGISGIYAEGFELFKYPESDRSDTSFSETFILAIHIICADNPTNRKQILDLSKLSNDPIKKFLNSYFRTPFNNVFEVPTSGFTLINKHDILKESKNFADFGWSFHPLIRTALIAFYSETVREEPIFKHANIELTFDGSSHGIAQMKSKLAFIGTLISFQKLRIDSLRKQWPKLDNLAESEVISLRARLSSLRNTWFWSRVSYDDQVQKTYISWASELDLNSDLEHMRKDLDEYWIVRAAQRATEEAVEINKLNKLARLFAVFGIVPAWLSILLSPLNGWIELFVGGVSLLGIVIFRKSVEKFINLLN